MIIANDELTPLEINQECYCNLYKDLYGVRPRHLTEEQWNSVEWLQSEIKFLSSNN